jgi:hypothetical protein
MLPSQLDWEGDEGAEFREAICIEGVEFREAEGVGHMH